jgi:hypothetical protein
VFCVLTLGGPATSSFRLRVNASSVVEPRGLSVDSDLRTPSDCVLGEYGLCSNDVGQYRSVARTFQCIVIWFANSAIVGSAMLGVS